MATAKIETDTGTKINVEGTVEDITAIITLFSKPSAPPKSIPSNDKNTPKKNKIRSVNPSASLVGYIRELKDSGFFDKPKLTALVKEKLDQEGHFYPMQSVSTCLINRNAKKELGRVKEGNKWAYVKR
jgi:hypothetical protein